MSLEVSEITVAPPAALDTASMKDIKEAWNKSKDFRVLAIWPPTVKSGTYINKDDVAKYCPDAKVKVRHKGLSGAFYIQ